MPGRDLQTPAANPPQIPFFFFFFFFFSAGQKRLHFLSNGKCLQLSLFQALAIGSLGFSAAAQSQGNRGLANSEYHPLWDHAGTPFRRVLREVHRLARGAGGTDRPD